MAITVIMNRELVAVLPDEPLGSVRSCIIGMGVTGVPVLDASRRPLGVVSLRDVVAQPEQSCARDCMTSPALVVAGDAPIRDAARLLSDASIHRLVVVDREGRAVGIVSALDIVRGLIGRPASHPVTFPHRDAETGLYFSDDHVLDMAEVEAAPDAPGLMLLIEGGVGITERIVWVEAAENVRDRLTSLYSHPMREPRWLMRLLDRGDLRFRAAAVEDPEERAWALGIIRGRLQCEA